MYLLYYKKLFLFFSCGGKINVFHRSLEAIDYAFPHTNSQLPKKSFRMMGQQNIFLQSWQDVDILTRSSSTSLRLYPLFFLHSILCSKKSPSFCFSFLINRILLLVLLCSCVWVFFKLRIVSWKLSRMKFTEGCGFGFSGGNIGESAPWLASKQIWFSTSNFSYSLMSFLR